MVIGVVFEVERFGVVFVDFFLYVLFGLAVRKELSNLLQSLFEPIFFDNFATGVG